MHLRCTLMVSETAFYRELPVFTNERGLLIDNGSARPEAHEPAHVLQC